MRWSVLLMMGLAACGRDGDGDGVGGRWDCDDADPAVQGPRRWLRDADGDGFVSLLAPYRRCEPLEGYVTVEGACADPGSVDCPADCDDRAPGVFPGAVEVCNGADDDCDGDEDEDAIDAAPYYDDEDGDGYGGRQRGTGCAPPGDATTVGGDCDDEVSSAYPGAPENCDRRDDDCDGLVDEDLPQLPLYADLDGDGAGAGPAITTGCGPTPGLSTTADDCDDADSDAEPGQQWYADADGDGFGAWSSSPLVQCERPDGRVAKQGDCDDTDPAVHSWTVWYADADGDGLGDQHVTREGCVTDPGWSLLGGDCDDGDPAVQTLLVYEDQDADGWGAGGLEPGCDGLWTSFVAGDCDDDDRDAWPGAPERCDGSDNDCDGAADEGDFTWFLDADGDGRGDPGAAVAACEAPIDHVAAGDDCDDADAQIAPGQPELCNGLDDDCDGVVDESGAAAVWTVDADGDGHGRIGGATRTGCTQPPGYALRADDCDDADRSVAPGVEEACGDGIDADCDGVDACAPQGLALYGEEPFEGLGEHVLAVPDVDGDGADELLVGSRHLRDDPGRLWSWSGGRLAEGPVSGGSPIRGEPGDDVGWSQAVVGDLDEDGSVDLAVTGWTEEAVYLVTADVAGPIDLAADAFAVLGTAGTGTGFGSGLLGGADFDGDGADDVWIGAPTDAGGSGTWSFYAGPVRGRRATPEGQLLGQERWDLVGADGSSGAADLDGDGDTDLLTCSVGSFDPARPMDDLYVVLEPPSGVVSLADADATGGNGETVSSGCDTLADYDGDGYADVLYAVRGSRGAAIPGRVEVFAGPFARDADLAEPVLRLTGPVGAWFGLGPASAGDVDGDGLDELVFAGDRGDEHGRAWLVRGGRSGALSADDADREWVMGPGSEGLWAIGGAGDLDGDGLGDLWVGEPRNGTLAHWGGAVLVLYGAELGL